MLHADFQGEGLPLGEFFGRDPAVDRGVFLARREILADGQDVHVGGGDVADQLGDLFLAFADTEHDAGLGDEVAGLGVLEHPEGAVVAGGLADRTLQAFNRLEVVIEDVGTRVE